MSKITTLVRDPVPAVRRRPRRAVGQALVEFGIASTVFFLIIFGAIDLGRVIFTYSELHNAVREGARFGKVHCDDATAIRNRVMAQAPTIALATGDINVSSTSCVPPDGRLTVSATTTFTAVTQSMLGISPITLNSSAVVDVE